MTRIKICGIKSITEAQMAFYAGAWAIGEVFAESPRRILVEDAARINHYFRDKMIKIGVFVNEDIDDLKYLLRLAALDVVQLHGDESPEYAGEIPVPVIKSFRVNKAVDPEYVKSWSTWAYLFDASSAEAWGGTGRTFNWAWLQGVGDNGRVILAGGLNPNNVGTAIRTVRPMAVDVSTGVEYPGGGKDPLKIRQFSERVKEADKHVS